MEEETVHMAARVPKSVEERVLNHVEKKNVRTKSHFLIEALEFYADYLDRKESHQERLNELEDQVNDLWSVITKLHPDLLDDKNKQLKEQIKTILAKQALEEQHEQNKK